MLRRIFNTQHIIRNTSSLTRRPDKPIHCRLGDVRRNRMGTVELMILHVMTSLLERRHKTPAAPVNGQNLILSPMRDEDTRRAMFFPGRHKARREGDNILEQVAIHQPD